MEKEEGERVRFWRDIGTCFGRGKEEDEGFEGDLR